MDSSFGLMVSRITVPLQPTSWYSSLNLCSRTRSDCRRGKLERESTLKRKPGGTVYLGRQPIYGVNREIRAYELLYRRAAADTTADVQNPDVASAQVMIQAFLEIGLAEVSPERPVFINHTRALLMMDPILPADRCVVEILEDVVPDDETLVAV